MNWKLGGYTMYQINKMPSHSPLTLCNSRTHLCSYQLPFLPSAKTFANILDLDHEARQNTGPKSWSKLFDTLMVFLKEFFKKICRQQKSIKIYPVGKELTFSHTPYRDFPCFCPCEIVHVGKIKNEQTRVYPWRYCNVKMMSPCRISAYSRFSGSLF